MFLLICVLRIFVKLFVVGNHADVRFILNTIDTNILTMDIITVVLSQSPRLLQYIDGIIKGSFPLIAKCSRCELASLLN